MARRRPTPPEQRFWQHVDRSGPVPVHRPDLGPCWVWTAYCDDNGYGRIARGPHGAGPMRATHVAWFVEHGSYPSAGLCACHSCDNPSCVRPSHLFLGTRADNNKDMHRKGRASDGSMVPRGASHYANTEPGRLARGEAHGCAKLDADGVRAIRAELDGGASVSLVARQRGVARSTVRRIRDREIWRHVS